MILICYFFFNLIHQDKPYINIALIGKGGGGGGGGGDLVRNGPLFHTLEDISMGLFLSSKYSET